MKYFLHGVLLVLLFWSPGLLATSVQPLALSYTYLQQPFVPDQAEKLDFTAYAPGEKLPLADYPQGAIFRVQLPAEIDRLGEFNLLVHPKYLSEVSAWFKQKRDGGWYFSTRGRLLANEPSYYSTNDLVFELSEDMDASSPIYLLIRSQGSPKPLSVELVTRKTYLQNDVSYSRYTVAVYTVILVLALINFVFYLFVREQAFLMYSIYMVLALNGMFWQEGWVGKLLFLPNTIAVDRWLHFFSMLPAVFFYRFYRLYLDLDRNSWVGKFFLGFQYVFAAIILFSQADSFLYGIYIRETWIVLFNSVLALGALSIFVLTLRYWIKGSRLAGYLFVANFVLILATLIRIAYAFNFSVENSYWQTHTFELALAIDAILLSLALADRTLSIKRERDQAKVELVRVDTAYQREQLLAAFVRKLQADAMGKTGIDISKSRDNMLFEYIKPIVPVAEIMVVTRSSEGLQFRCLGENRILGTLFEQLLVPKLPALMNHCAKGMVVNKDIYGFPDAKERYQYLMIPVEIREDMEYCMLLLLPRDYPLDRDLISGLREFVEKAVHALLNAAQVEQLRYSARYDDLTRVLNRASVEVHISNLLVQSSEGGAGLALAFVDIDNFKRLNDSMGHDYGDKCLKLLCNALQRILPQESVVGRFGGDEFLVLLPGYDFDKAYELMDALNPLLTVLSRDEAHVLSVSIGIAECKSGQRLSMAALLKQADKSLYSAKAAGRARVGRRITKTGD